MSVFDIETAPLDDLEFDPSEVKLGNLKDEEKIAAKIEDARQKYQRDAALSAITGQVCAIGVKSAEYEIFVGEEPAVLAGFWKVFRRSHTEQLVGFNIFRFDLPFLVRRSWVCGVDVPPIRSGRFWSDRFIDLMDLWQLGDRQAKGTLSQIDRLLGGEGKKRSGKDFASLLRDDQEEAIAYLRNDLDITERVAQRMRAA